MSLYGIAAQLSVPPLRQPTLRSTSYVRGKMLCSTYPPYPALPVHSHQGTFLYTVNIKNTQSLLTMPNPPTGDPKQHDPSEFSESLSGSCLCGSITVTISDKDLFKKPRGHLCHCANCRKVAGSYVASNLLIEEENVKIEDKDGTLTVYEDKATLSGNPVYRKFCGKDGKYEPILILLPDV